MEFIGRTKELSDLEQEYNNSHSFVVIYGRRRIGKTALIQEFIKGKPALYFLATEESEKLILMIGLSSSNCLPPFLAKIQKCSFLMNFSTWLIPIPPLLQSFKKHGMKSYQSKILWSLSAVHTLI